MMHVRRFKCSLKKNTTKQNKAGNKQSFTISLLKGTEKNLNTEAFSYIEAYIKT